MAVRARINLNMAQRVVLVVAFGLVLLLVWQWLEAGGLDRFSQEGGWYGYAPNSGVAFTPATELVLNPHSRSWARLGLVIVWCVPSLWILRTRPTTVPSETHGG